MRLQKIVRASPETVWAIYNVEDKFEMMNSSPHFTPPKLLYRICFSAFACLVFSAAQHRPSQVIAGSRALWHRIRKGMENGSSKYGPNAGAKIAKELHIMDLQPSGLHLSVACLSWKQLKYLQITGGLMHQCTSATVSKRGRIDPAVC